MFWGGRQRGRGYSDWDGVDVADLNAEMLETLHRLKHRWSVGVGSIRMMRGLEHLGYARWIGGTELRPEYEITDAGLDYLHHVGRCLRRDRPLAWRRG